MSDENKTENADTWKRRAEAFEKTVMALKDLPEIDRNAVLQAVDVFFRPVTPQRLR